MLLRRKSRFIETLLWLRAVSKGERPWPVVLPTRAGAEVPGLLPSFSLVAHDHGSDCLVRSHVAGLCTSSVCCLSPLSRLARFLGDSEASVFLPDTTTAMIFQSECSFSLPLGRVASFPSALTSMTSTKQRQRVSPFHPRKCSMKTNAMCGDEKTIASYLAKHMYAL